MDKYVMFMNRKTEYCYKANSSKLDHRFNVIAIKIPANYIVNINKLIKFI